MPLVVVFNVERVYIDDQTLSISKFELLPWPNQRLPLRLIDILVHPGHVVDRRNAKLVYKLRQIDQKLYMMMWFEERVALQENIRPPLRM